MVIGAIQLVVMNDREASAMYRGLGFDKDGVGREYVDNGVGLSVSCMKD